MKPLVIYHANCADGFGAAFAAWLKLGDEAEYLPMQYLKADDDMAAFCNKSGIDDIDGREIFILDFSLPKVVMEWLFAHAKRVVWLDHHKTAFEMWCDGIPDGGLWVEDHTTIGGHHYVVLDNDKSGALLAWEYFHPGTEVPMLIRHIDDYDRWQFKLDGTKAFNKALWSYAPWSFEQWRGIFLSGLYEPGTWRVPDEFYIEGEAILRAHEQNVAAVVKGAAMRCSIHEAAKYLGYESGPCGDIDVYEDAPRGLAANCPPHLTSDVGHELANKSGTFGLCWHFDRDGVVRCQLRSNGDYDVSAIARCFGGGGHRNAAGFSTNIQTLMGWLK